MKSPVPERSRRVIEFSGNLFLTLRRDKARPVSFRLYDTTKVKQVNLITFIYLHLIRHNIW